jgi:hypothetical protein
VECYTLHMTLSDVQRRLTKNAEQQQKLLGEFSAAVAKQDTSKQAAIQQQLLKLATEMQHLSDEQHYARTIDRPETIRPRSRATGKTIREQSLDILDEIGVPLSPATISEFGLATTGIELSSSRFASMRRDEERASKRDIGSRPAWIVPALSTDRLTQIPRLLTNSSWQLERRIVGARSLRVNHLRTTLAFLNRFERLHAADAQRAKSIEALVLRYARGVPGAIASGLSPEPAKIRAVVQSELEAIDAEDLAERRQAAERLNRFSDTQRLWGLPPSLEGGAHVERATR